MQLQTWISAICKSGAASGNREKLFCVCMFRLFEGCFRYFAGVGLQRGVRPLSWHLFPDLFLAYFREAWPDRFFSYLWAVSNFRF